MLDRFTTVFDSHWLKKTGELNKLKPLYSSTSNTGCTTSYLVLNYGCISTSAFQNARFFGVMAGQLAFYVGTETTLKGMDQTV